jgi:hypothetical protein
MDGLDAIMAELSGEKALATPQTTSSVFSKSSGPAPITPRTGGVARQLVASVDAPLPTGGTGAGAGAGPGGSGDGVSTRLATAASPPSTSRGRARSGGQQRAVSATDIEDIIRHLPPHVAARVAYFEEKLKQFALNLADPASRSKVNIALAQEPFAAFVDYYRRNPKLAKYSVKQDLQRLDYRVTPHGPA